MAAFACAIPVGVRGPSSVLAQPARSSAAPAPAVRRHAARAFTASRSQFVGAAVARRSAPAKAFAFRPVEIKAEITPELEKQIEDLVKNNKVVLFMKGNRLMPQCGFSNTVVQILERCNVPYETCDILADPDMRQGMKEYSSWPTFPQVYIDGEFVGGCDIMLDLFQSGELQSMLEVAMNS
eukprot:tig00001264_g7870.t1